MTPEDRKMVDHHLSAVHEIMLRESMVRLTGGWKFEGQAADGRRIVHKFKLDGYEKAVTTKVTHSSSTSTFGEPEDQQETEQWESEKATCKHHGWPPGWKCIECGEIVPELEKNNG